MNEEDTNFAYNVLKGYTYRDLQQIAKSMGLPSNVKKVHLIALIHAKKFKTDAEVNNIVQRVKLERQKLKKRSLPKKLHVQGTEISSTSNSLSPPITVTPKRRGHIVVPLSPDTRQAITKLKQNPNIITLGKKPLSSLRKPNASDRVLRSFNIKTVKNRQYGNFSLSNSVLDITRVQNCVSSKETKVVKQEVRYPKINVTANCVVKKYRPAILNTSANFGSKRPEIRNEIALTNHANTVPMIAAKRQRLLSGVYPLVPKQPTIKKSVGFIQSVGIRGKDGKISLIKALVQKTLPKSNAVRENLTQINNIEVTVQDLINCNIDSQTSNTRCATPDTNMPNDNYVNLTIPSISDVPYEQTNFDNSHAVESYSDACKENDYLGGAYSVYYHKKIRAEQVRSQRNILRDPKDSQERLPRINDAFSRFNEIRSDVSQPIYVQVSEESERLTNYPIYKTNNTNLLEGLYNFRNQFMVNQPLLQIATTTNTRCVYTTHTVPTPIAQQTSTLIPGEYVSSWPERDDGFCSAETNALPRISELLRFAEQDDGRRDYTNDDDLLSPSSSFGRSACQELGANVTIPEMEDALEIISQDGDYMERIGMDLRVQCLLCSWDGPRIMLESHIRKEHTDQIHKQEKNEWTITFTLGSLVRRQHWCCQLLQRGSALYALSVKYTSSDCFMATLSSISTDSELPKTGSIIIYNKVTGEPFAWEGTIQNLHPDMPYENDVDCLKLKLSSLDLLPNSANLKLLNGELVLKSPTKVVVGQPELNDIHVILFVKAFD